MLYRFCNANYIEGYIEIEYENRNKVVHWVKTHTNNIQDFSVAESGHIFGYAVELSDETEKPTAILYKHTTAGFIWIEIG